MRYRLELIVFISGAIVMVAEIIGSRVFAPFLGTSLYVWTALIGVVLGSLSVGYWWGGRLSDRYPSWRALSLILLVPAFYFALVGRFKWPVLAMLADTGGDVRIMAVIAAVVLFAPPAVVLGMVSPYAVRLRLNDLAHSGATVGTLYALSTLGSIAGTFAAGFFLIPLFGSTAIIYGIALGLLALSLVASLRSDTALKVAALAVIVLAGWGAARVSESLAADGMVYLETPYNTAMVVEAQRNGRPVRELLLGNEHSSARYLEGEELVYEYTKYYDLVRHFRPGAQQALMLGGAGYSYPQHFLREFPAARLDVVEIDPGVTQLAREHFGLQADDRLRIFHEDGRTFLNRSGTQYDVVFGDAFSSYHSLPFQLATVEAVQALHDRLTTDGVAIINVIGSIEGDTGRFTRAIYHTFDEVFAETYLFPVYTDRADTVQNIMLVALKEPYAGDWQDDSAALQEYLDRRWQSSVTEDIPALTDDYAPVDALIAPMVR